MSDLEQNIAAYDRMREQLEAEELYRWVLFHDEKYIGAYDSFHDAMCEAVPRFGRGPYLVRQVGARPLVLPPSLLYQPIHG